MDFKEQLKSQIDIVKVIGDYVRLKRQGSTDNYKGLCPFHQEKTPSFSVTRSKQMYYCHGCHVGGDVLKFVMEIDGLTFLEALQLLAERNGIPMPKRSDYSDPEAKLRGALFEIHSIANSLFQSNLLGPQGSDARAYLDKRGVSAELIETFGLGFSERSGQSLVRRLAQEQFTQEQLDKSGLVRRRDDGSGSYDFFRGRLMFPIHDESGKVVAFGGRAMRDEDQPKYLNSPETPIYRKTSVLYNLHRARNEVRRSNEAVFLEGYMDVIEVYGKGEKKVIACCGTALTPIQARAIHRHCDNVVIAFDSDNAGRNSAEKAIDVLVDEGLRVRMALTHEETEVDGKLDPDEYVKQNGIEAFRDRIKRAAPSFHWLADRARLRFDMNSASGRFDAFKSLMPRIEKLSDKLERAAVASDVAGILRVDARLVLDQFKRADADRRPPVHPDQGPPIPKNEYFLLQALIASEEARTIALPRLAGALMHGLELRELFETIAKVTESGVPVTVSAIEERLSDASKDLLRRIVNADKETDEGPHLKNVQKCLDVLEKEQTERYVDELTSKINAAEREGRIKEAYPDVLELDRARRRLSRFRGSDAGVVH